MHKLGSFVVAINPKEIVVSRNVGSSVPQSLSITPAEVDKICSIINLADKMISIHPPTIYDNPFRVVFNDNTITVTRDGIDTGIEVEFNEIDLLIRSFKDGLASLLDKRILRTGPRAGVSIPTPDPIIDGR